MTHLSDRLNAVKDAGLNIEAAVRAAQEAGHGIDRGTVYRYLKGDHAKNPSDDTLAALEAVFGVPITELRTLAGKPAGELGPYKPPAYANRLNRDQRKALDRLILTIVEADGTAANNEETRQRVVERYELEERRAARRGQKTPNRALEAQEKAGEENQDE